MKHLFIISLLLSFGFSAFAQTEQGSKFIGGSFGISTASFSNGNNSSTFELSPRFGYFVKDQWTVGSGQWPGSNGDTDVFFSISPFTRYYFPIVENQFFIFGEAGFGLSFSDDKVFHLRIARICFFPHGTMGGRTWLQFDIPEHRRPRRGK